MYFRKELPQKIGRHIGIDEAEPFSVRQHAADADPARMRFADPLRRQRRTLDQCDLRMARGKIADDGIERISTQTLFDHLEVFQRGRGGGACRRLARVMRDLGWTPVRVRDLNRGGYLEQVRGYSRDALSR